jgi:TPR repeat protein
MYLYGSGVHQDFAQAAFWWRKAAEQGDAQAQENLIPLYARGLGVQRDEDLAESWSRKAAEQRNAGAKTESYEVQARKLRLTLPK